MSDKPGKLWRCDFCEAQYIPRRIDQRFCSRACHVGWHVDQRKQAMKAWKEMGRQNFLSNYSTSNESDSEIQPAKRRAV
jgi:hypothetical protein